MSEIFPSDPYEHPEDNAYLFAEIDAARAEAQPFAPFIAHIQNIVNCYATENHSRYYTSQDEIDDELCQLAETADEILSKEGFITRGDYMVIHPQNNPLSLVTMHKANERTHATLHSLREPSRLTVEGGVWRHCY